MTGFVLTSALVGYVVVNKPHLFDRKTEQFTIIHPPEEYSKDMTQINMSAPQSTALAKRGSRAVKVAFDLR